MSLVIRTITQPNLRRFNLVFVRFLRSQLKCKPNLSAQEPMPVFRRAAKFYNKVALQDSLGSYTYGSISMAAKELSHKISKKINEKINSQITFFCPNDASYVITQWAIWMTGQAAVPVSNQYPFEMIKYFVKNSDSKLLITTSENADFFDQVASATKIEMMILDSNVKETALQKTISTFDQDSTNSFDVDNTNAMILYTSGSTGCPKGVVLTHKQILNQIIALVDAWKLRSDDAFLHALPLYQSHGIVNGLLCPFYVGAKCIMLPKFDANDVWARLLGINSTKDRQKVTVFMGTPNIYNTLIDEYNNLFGKDSKVDDYIRTTLKSKIRMMTCGSNALSPVLYQKWFEITGHKLLQHYGMTETGMFFSQRYGSNYEHGYVGQPLKGCSVRIRKKNEDDKYETLLDCTNINNDLKVNLEKNVSTITGELFLKGNGLFKKYFNKSIDNEFTDDFWFKPGDMCQYSSENNMFKVLGRTDFDIIDAGDIKISAFQVETQLLNHSEVSDCAVFGVSDDKSGSYIAALVVLKSEVSCDVLKQWMKSHIPEKAVPKIIKVVPYIPKNTLGKVDKAELSLQMYMNNQEIVKH